MVDDMETLAARLEAFVPTGDEFRDIERLKSLVEQWQTHPSGSRTALSLLLQVFERNPNNTEFGSPGPLVHAVESAVGYESELFASVTRVPSFYTLWMVNRLLNTNVESEQRMRWLTLLRDVIKRPGVTESLREQATSFLERQIR